MFNKNFYPTPLNIALQMTTGVQNSDYILEPSAGKGDLLKHLNSKYNKYNNIYCIEIEPDLQTILKDKEYKVIHNDFLSFKSDLVFDYIIMNPPFDQGAKHLLKAFEISKGAEIRCLLNKETIDNPCTKERNLLAQILKDNSATVKYLGSCFASAERPTGVEVVLITLKSKSESNYFKFNSVNVETEKRYDFDSIKDNQVAKIDVFQNLESRFDRTSEAFARLVKCIEEIRFYSDGLTDKYNDVGRYVKDYYSTDSKVFYNKIIEDFRDKCWKYVFTQTKIANFTTNKVREDFYKFQREQGAMPFTANNILNLLDNLFFNQGEIMNQCILDAFDLMTKYYPENRCHIEGWKTNDAWKVNKKIIMPLYFSKWEIEGEKEAPLWYGNAQVGKLQDIEKGLCFIAGKKFESINSIANVSNAFWGVLCNSEFFTFRVYKKGTIHLTFKDEYIWEQFNIVACKGKNWLKAS